jgi:SpoIID/LytB domain protein
VDTLWAFRKEEPGLLDLARPAVRPARPAAFLAALLSAFFLFGLTFAFMPGKVLGATTMAAACGVNLRTSASVSGAIRSTVGTGTKITVVATVTGGSWRATCGGRSVSGNRWYRISAINGRSVASLYGRSYLYGATGLIKAVVVIPTPTPSPTPAPTPSLSTPAPTPSPTRSPTPTPTPVPTPSPSPSPSTTTLAAACDGVNLRTSASTSGAIKTSVMTDTTIAIVATVTGGSWQTLCAGASVSGSTWYRISTVNGKSVSALYGVSYLYAATGLFKVVAAPAPTPTGSTALGETVIFYGRGWGHGVGLSQYGARGRALAGQDAATILAHYYQGATIGTTANTEIRVLVLEKFAATATSPLSIYGRGGEWTIDGIAAIFPADARLRAIPDASTGTTTWQLIVDGAGGAVLWDAPFSGDLRVRPAANDTRLQLWSKPSSYDRYRGTLRIIATASVNVINELPLETYLRSVVPAEMPASWPTEALKAQTIAARSYAAVQLRPGTSTFDVYDDTRSQVYLGSLHEDPATDGVVAATTGQVLRSGSAIANALFHSTGGGATENNENAFVSSTGSKVAGPVSYLRGSSDRASNGTAYDAGSPYATWQTATYTRSQLAAIFVADSRTNVGTLVALDLRDRGVSGRLISVTLIGSTGTTRKVSGDVFGAVFNAQKPTGDPILRSNLLNVAPIP